MTHKLVPSIGNNSHYNFSLLATLVLDFHYIPLSMEVRALSVLGDQNARVQNVLMDYVVRKYIVPGKNK